MSDHLKPGVLVRILTAPDRQGVLDHVVGGKPGNQKWLVRFPDGPQRLPERNLEVVNEGTSVDSDIERGLYGGADSLRLAITHSRLTGRLADMIYSMEATNTDFLAYQFKPVLNLLDSPSDGILIADEVGLGKTIEAGLIWTELRAREDARKLLIVSPAVLREKWQLELKRRFGVRSDVVNADALLATLRGVERGEEHEFALIASMQGLRPSREWEDEEIDTASARLARYLEDAKSSAPLFDLIVIDEAHYLRNETSQTYQLGKLLRPVTKQLVFLSATPIHLGSKDLFNLLNIIDAENFRYPSSFDDVLKANSPLIKLADAFRKGEVEKSTALQVIEQALAHRLLKNSRQLQALREAIGEHSEKLITTPELRVALADRLDSVNLLSNVVNRTRKRDVQENRVVREPVAISVPMTPTENDFYRLVTEQVRLFCLENDLHEGFMVCIPQRQMCSSMPAALAHWSNTEISLENEDDFEPEVIESIDDQDVRRTGTLVSELAKIAASTDVLGQLIKDDSKFKALENNLNDYFLAHPEEKVIIFSYFRATLSYLEKRLEQSGHAPLLLMGGMKDKKSEVIEEFSQVPTRRILLASEVLSEGVDLQFCSTLINYDLPWNPMRVEQRIGRIDRIGQQRPKINILNFFYQDTLDDKIYDRLFRRLDIFRQALGDLEAVLGAKIRSLTSQLLGHSLSAEQEIEAINQTASAIEQDRLETERLEDQAVHLHAYSDYINRKVDAAKQLKRYIRPQDLWHYAEIFLKQNYPGTKLVVEQREPLTAQIELSSAARVALNEFIELQRLSQPTKLLAAKGANAQRYVFSNQIDFGKPNLEIINQSHPLIRWIAGALKHDQLGVGKPVAIEVNMAEHSAPFKPGAYVFLVRRWSFSGAKNIERLAYGLYSLEHGAIYQSEIAESLILNAMENAATWGGAAASVNPKDVLSARDSLEDSMDNAFDDELAREKDKNNDRIDQLMVAIEEKTRSQIQSSLDAIATLEARNRPQLIPAQRGRIAKAEERRDSEIGKLESRRSISADPRDVISGLIYVTA